MARRGNHEYLNQNRKVKSCVKKTTGIPESVHPIKEGCDATQRSSRIALARVLDVNDMISQAITEKENARIKATLDEFAWKDTP